MSRKPALLLRLVILSAVCFVFSVIPTSIVERGSLCIIFHLTGYKCITCGMTRAFSNAMHFEFARAFSFNPLIAVFFPLFIFILADELAALVSLFRGGSYKSTAERIFLKTPGSVRRRR